MDRQSTSESGDKSAESKATKGGKAKGKRPVDSDTKPSVDVLTQKAKGLNLGGPKSPKDTEITATSKGKATADSKTESVVKSCYSLRSGPKGMDVDVKPTRASTGTKRKGQDIKRDVPGACKATGKRRHSDHDDKDGTGAASRTTRSGSKKSKAN